MLLYLHQCAECLAECSFFSSCFVLSLHKHQQIRLQVDPRHATGAACLPVYRRDGKRAVYCAQGWNAHLSPEQLLMQTTATTSTPTMSTSTAAAAVTVAVSSDYASAAGLVLSVRQSQIKLAAALGAYHCLTLGYPHVMPGLQGGF